jgi:hypothetical protein
MQDWHLIDGKEMNGYTMLKYKRPLKTCDTKNDLEIKRETNYLIFAWNNVDPVGDGDWEPHGPNRRIGVEFLLNFKPIDQNLETQIQDSLTANKVELTLNNVNLLETFK